jgi:P pilus assembly chaperone PapD
MAPIAHTFYLAIGAVLLGLYMQTSQAAIVVQGTRVIFPANVDDVTVRLANSSSKPVLAQSWVDDGHAEMAPEDVQVPFVVAPAVSRIDPGGGAVLRVSRIQSIAVADRESLFWLNVLETPPRGASDDAVLQFAFRTRLKLLYRPTALEAGVDTAPERLKWKLVVTPKSTHTTNLEVANPTPYYVSFGHIEVDYDGQAFPVKTGMVAPFGRTVLTTSTRLNRHAAPLKVRYEAINDYGARRMFEQPFGE